MTQKVYHIDKNNLTLLNFFSNNTFKLALQYVFHVVVLFDTVFYLKLNFKLRQTKKRVCTFKNLKKFRKPDRNFSKANGHPVIGKFSKIKNTDHNLNFGIYFIIFV